MKEPHQSRPLASPKVNANGSKNPTLSFRVRGDLYERLRDNAQANSLSLSEAIERRLTKSFDLEENLFLQEEIKTEMRGTIAALEARIAFMEEWDRLLWPDESARAFGRAFAMTLVAVQHATGQHWRESPMAAPIVAGVVRRMIDGCSRGGSLASDLFDRDRITAITAAIAQTALGNFDKTMPPLPPLQPQDDPANWTNHAHTAMTFRDIATGELLQVVKGPEFVLTDPKAKRGLGPDFHAAIERFRPIRDTIDAEEFIVYALKDGSTSWQRLSGSRGKVHVPAGQDAPPPEPAFRPATPDELAGMVDAPGQLPPEIGDRAMFDEAAAGLPLVKAEAETKKANPFGRAPRAMRLDDPLDERPVPSPRTIRRKIDVGT